MCGRYTLIRTAAEVGRAFDLDGAPDWGPRYNVAPTQPVFVVRLEGDRRRAALLRWGLVPAWAAAPDGGPPLINARAETAAEKPAFRSALRQRRCLVPADGFYEWKAAGGGKRPHHFTLSDGGLFAIAGLWERWEGEGGAVESVALLTTEANELVRGCHDRMPVIVPPGSQAAWLGPAGAAELPGLRVPYPAAGMAVREVGKAVGSPRNEGPQCLELSGPTQRPLF